MRCEKLELDCSRWKEGVGSMEGPEIDELVLALHAHFGCIVLSDERTRSAVVEEGIRVECTVTEFCANFKNRQVRGPTEAALSRYVDGVRGVTTY